MTKNYSEFEIYHTLDQFFFKSFSLNLTHQGSFNNTKSAPKFLFNFWF